MNETMKSVGISTFGDYRVVGNERQWAVREMNDFIANHPGKIITAGIIEKFCDESGNPRHTIGWKVTITD